MALETALRSLGGKVAPDATPGVTVVASSTGVRALAGDKFAVPVYLLDNSMKNLLLDARSTVADAIFELLNKLGLAHVHSIAPYFALGECLDGVTIGRPLRHDANVLEVMSKWPSGAAATAKFIFNIKLFLPRLEESPDARLSYLIYIQAVYSVISGIYPVTPDECTTLAALQVQAKFGPHKPDVHKFGYLSAMLRGLVPSSMLTAEAGRSSLDWERDILARHAGLTGDAVARPMAAYVALLRTKDFYGAACFTMRQKFSGLLPQLILLAVSGRGVLLLDKASKVTMEKYGFHQMHKWGFKPEETFYFELKPSVSSKSKGMTFDFETRLGSTVSDILTDYANQMLLESAAGTGGDDRAAGSSASTGAATRGASTATGTAAGSMDRRARVASGGAPRQYSPEGAAIKLQASFRGFKVRADLQRHWAAVRIQSIYRGYRARIAFDRMLADLEASLRAKVHAS